MEVVDKQVVDDQLDDGSLILVSGPSRGGKSRWAESLLIDEPRRGYDVPPLHVCGSDASRHPNRTPN